MTGLTIRADELIMAFEGFGTAVREDWFRFHEQAFMKIIQAWLDDYGVEVTLVPCQAQS